MMSRSALPRLIVVGATALALSGCITLLPKSKEAHLYRFGQPASSEAAQVGPGQIGLFRTNGTFPRASAGDRILTIDAGKAAYIAETRWVAPASTLWDEAVNAAFDADPGPTRLVSRGEAVSADYILRLDVRNFEAVYEHGSKAPPTVLVRVRAVISRGADRSMLTERIFEKKVTAGDNRVSAIVPAYDRAVADVLRDVIAWANEQAKPV